MYCIKCGVELSDSESKCPLCSTVVYHPDIKRDVTDNNYPPFSKSEETVSRSGVNFILSVISLLFMLLTLLCDMSLNNSFTWSGYVISSVALFYIIIVFPLWFKKPNPVIFVSIDFVSTALFLYTINYYTKGEWFATFALPVVGCAALIVVSVVTLARYIKRGYLYIIGSAIIACGLFAVLIEYLINYTFHIRQAFMWSIYPLVTFILIGIAMFIIAMSKPLRESLHRKFFV